MTQYSKDLAAGGLFVIVGLLFVVWSAFSLRMGTPDRMGPGFFPIVVGSLLCALGIAVATLAFLRHRKQPADNTADEPWPWRPLLMIGLSPLAFAFTIERLGLIAAALLTLLVAFSATKEIGNLKRLAIAAGFTAFCVLVFKYGLGVPFDLTWFS